jgi:hypothetical protein
MLKKSEEREHIPLFAHAQAVCCDSRPSYPLRVQSGPPADRDLRPPHFLSQTRAVGYRTQGHVNAARLKSMVLTGYALIPEIMHT